MIIHSDCLTFLKQLKDASHDCVITSPPYNKKGLRGGVKTSENIWKGSNVDYDAYGDNMPEGEYRHWQKEILNECYRILKPGGSIFYNHKITQKRLAEILNCSVTAIEHIHRNISWQHLPRN